jgi:serine/threonine protein kinase
VAQLDRRVDVYSLGATLYQVLTGQPPFAGFNALEVSRIQSEEPRPPRALVPDLPVDLEAIVLKCLEKERSARYDSARALRCGLTRRAEPGDSQAAPYPLRPNTRRLQVLRHPLRVDTQVLHQPREAVDHEVHHDRFVPPPHRGTDTSNGTADMSANTADTSGPAATDPGRGRLARKTSFPPS